MTLLHPSTERCICGHGPWSHRLIAFRQADGQLLSTPGICSSGDCDCQTYAKQYPRIIPPRRPRRIPPLGYTWKMDL